MHSKDTEDPEDTPGITRGHVFLQESLYEEL
jgi:hypothetical protein